jgi:hypothetical protein
MKLLLIAAFLWLPMVVPASADQPADPRRVALVIGNGSYRFVAALANSRNDAKLIAATLKRDGFTLVGGGPQFDLDKPQFDKAIQTFGTMIEGATVAVFYYAGHGLQIAGTNYLVPVGANPVREADSDFQLVDANHVLHQMRDADTKLNVLILDACRNNPFGGRGLRAVGSGLAQMQAPSGTFISYATQPGNVAQDGTDGNGPYAKALSAALQQPGLELFQVFNQTGLKVAADTGGEQQPWMSNSPIRGQFFFVPPGSTVTIQTPPAPSDPEIVFWESIRNSPDRNSFEAYLQQYPAGKFAALARLRMAALGAPVAVRTDGDDPRFLHRKPRTGEIRNGVRVLVDDGSCPAGQVLEIIGGDLANGKLRQERCIAKP